MKQRVWDLPTRLFHWGLAVAATTAFFSGGEPTWGRLHATVGWAAAALVAFRVGWGFVGERWSRWSGLGHGPGHGWKAAASAGAAMVAVAALTVTGAVVLGGEEARGPLAAWIPASTGVAVHELHAALAWAGAAWLAVHLAGVARQSWLDRQNLVLGMITGRKRTDEPPVRARIGVAAAMSLTATLGLAWAAAVQRPPAPRTTVDADWSRECGDCHLAFPPSLLPAATWTAMLAPDADHFGESLGLDPELAGRLTAFAVAEAADRGATEHAVRIAAEAPTGARITRTDTWIEAHASVDESRFDRPEVGSRLRCDACHPDASDGTFDARAVGFPVAEPARPATAEGRDS